MAANRPQIGQLFTKQKLKEEGRASPLSLSWEQAHQASRIFQCSAHMNEHGIAVRVDLGYE